MMEEVERMTEQSFPASVSKIISGPSKDTEEENGVAGDGAE